MTNIILDPDGIKGMVFLGNTSDTYSQPRHLPCDDNQLNCKQFNAEILSHVRREVKYEVLGLFKLLFNRLVKETQELFPRNKIDNIFDSSKFKTRFAAVELTTYRVGIE